MNSNVSEVQTSGEVSGGHRPPPQGPAPGSKVKVGPWEWTAWPTLPLPSHEWLVNMGASKGPAWLHEFHARREKQIFDEQKDPLQYGWEQPPLKLVRALLAGTYVPGMMGSATAAGKQWKQNEAANDVLLLGGNGSGKTECQAKLAMEILAGSPNMEARCFSQNEATSKRYIQRAMYRYLPPALRNIKREGQTVKISYSEATGFSKEIFVLPNHGTCLFPTYKGWEQDKKSVEGGECDVLTWDEEAPGEMLETVRFRAHKKGGTVLGGFTPVAGYTETVAQYIEGATILETIPARAIVWDWWRGEFTWGEWLLPKDKELVKGCPKGHVPLVVQSGQGRGRRFAVVFPTMFNPYTNVDAIVSNVEGKPMDFALERLWGWPTKLARKAFPNFGEDYLVKPERIPPLNTLTLYHFMDPHGQRNWFMLWIGVDANGTKWVFREWPDIEVGEWALPGTKPDGKPGPGQNAEGGKGFNGYKRLVLDIERWKENAGGIWEASPDAWTVHDRRMDPRPAGTSVPSDEEALTYLDHLQEAVKNKEGVVLLPGLDVMAAPHCGIEDGTQLINDWLTQGWNHKEPVTPMNCPKLYISRACENLIWALRTYTGADGEKGACKDPIDCLKGAAKMDIEYVAPGAMGSYGGWGGY